MYGVEPFHPTVHDNRPGRSDGAAFHLVDRNRLARPLDTTGLAGDAAIQRVFHLIGGGLVQCSCAAASGHAEPMAIIDNHVSTSLPLSVR